MFLHLNFLLIFHNCGLNGALRTVFRMKTPTCLNNFIVQMNRHWSERQDLNLRCPSENIIVSCRLVHSLLKLIVFVTRFAPPSENIIVSCRSVHSLLKLIVFVTRFEKTIINRFFLLTLHPRASKIDAQGQSLYYKIFKI